MTTPPHGTAARARAEALFKPQVSDGADASRHDRDAARDTEAEKTARLRALRLAKEASDRIAAEVRRARREQRRP